MEDLPKGQAAYSVCDYDTAVKHFALAAEQGNAEAQFNLGFCYGTGKSVGKMTWKKRRSGIAKPPSRTSSWP